MPKLLVDCPSEEIEQISLIRVAKHSWWGKYLFAIPNGGWRHKATAAKLKMQGVRPGVPDLFLAFPANGKPGLFIEMKRQKKATISDHQQEFIELLKSVGYEVHVCYGWQQAFETIKQYLGGTRPI